MITMKAGQFFFDSKKVLRAVKPARRKALQDAAKFVRVSARSSIRKARRKKLSEMSPKERRRYQIAVAIAKRRGKPKPKAPFASSKPGEPPRSQTGLLRKFLLYAYDIQSESVVIGPAKINRATGAPETLEYGGATIVRRRKGKTTRTRVKIAARPFMQPALEAELDNIPEQWRGAVSRG